MRVLFVSHTSAVSGAERSLLDLLGALPSGLRPLLATPPGPLQALAEDLAIPTARVHATAGSLRVHPLHTPVAVAELSAAAWQLSRLAKRHRCDLVHANSIRAGIALGLARIDRTPKIVHVRDCLPPGPFSTAVLRLIGATATTIVANSRYTAASVQRSAPRARVEVVHNPVDLARFDPATLGRTPARARLGDAGGARWLLGLVAQLSPWKGQDTAIEALRLVRQQGLDAHLLLIGSAKFLARSARFDNESYVARLRAQVARAGLEDRVFWLGEREDVPAIIRALDLLLLPSWEEPFGRAVTEAMALEVPVLATDIGGPSEIIEDGREGYLVPPHEPRAWARAIRRVVESRDGGRGMGRAGRLRVEQAFTSADHVAAMIGIYESAIALTKKPGAL